MRHSGTFTGNRVVCASHVCYDSRQYSTQLHVFRVVNVSKSTLVCSPSYLHMHVPPSLTVHSTTFTNAHSHSMLCSCVPTSCTRAAPHTRHELDFRNHFGLALAQYTLTFCMLQSCRNQQSPSSTPSRVQVLSSCKSSCRTMARYVWAPKKLTASIQLILL